MARASLTKYNTKRNFTKTPEPAGIKPSKQQGWSFVIQKHAASHLHYDFRLELDGVLKSWAVPKEPSKDPSVKRLAVEVEDHPLEYGSFEGVIPKGQYGGGVVKIWDSGSWAPKGDPRVGLKEGKLAFTLKGTRLKGDWALIRIKNRKSSDKSNWLLIKENNDSDIRTTKTSPQKSKSAKLKNSSVKLSHPILPNLATLVDKAPAGDDWLHEVKFDGYRILAEVDKGKVSLYTRKGLDWTAKFKSLSQECKDFADGRSLVLDSELVYLDDKGLSDFQKLQNTISAKKDENLKLFVFDILKLDDDILIDRPLAERKELLKGVFESSPQLDQILESSFIVGNGMEVYRNACKQGLEGIISKDLNSVYIPGRGRNWLKVKCQKRQEFVIGGFTSGISTRPHFGALLLGVYEDDELRYCGRVGTGFTDESLKSLKQKLAPLQTTKSPFAKDLTTLQRKDVYWVKPNLICEVEFSTWTQDRLIRHATFAGLREDKAANEVHQELTKNLRPNKRSSEKTSAQVSDVQLTNPDKILYPKTRTTKQDLADYYASVASQMLPYVIDRPLTLLRCPEGSQKECFYQRHFTDVPDEVYEVKVPKDDKTSMTSFVIKDEPGLKRLAQLGVLEIHSWGSLATSAQTPDTVTFDLDPGPGVGMEKITKAALLVRDCLETLGLSSFVKTSGGKGLHVVVPIKPTSDWDTVKQFSKHIAQILQAMRPELFVATMSKAKRPKRIFVDYLRNTQAATSVAVYSTRAKPTPTVSTPLHWKEVKATLDPLEFTIQSVPKRLRKQRQDPWRDYSKVQKSQSISMKLLKSLAEIYMEA